MAATQKLPAIQFYPGDWRKDVGVQSLSFQDRGIWFEILMLMHESERRGLLLLNGKAMSEDAIARVLGLDKQTLTTTLTNLLDAGVASVDEETGALKSRRMVRDEELRKARAEAGSKGGNPALVKQNSTTPDKQKPTPSSSSSTSSSTAEEKQKPSRAKREGDPRHVPFRDAVQAYTKHMQVLYVWDASAAKQLDALLQSAPALTLDVFKGCLWNRARSPGVPHGQHPRAWLLKILDYQQGPLNEFGKTGEPGGTFKGKTERSTDAAQQAIDEFAARARAAAERGADHPHAASSGYPPTSEAGQGRLLGAG